MDHTIADLCFTSGRELARLIRGREVSANEVMSAHLRQIERVNPKVNAIVARPDGDVCLVLPNVGRRRPAIAANQSR